MLRAPRQLLQSGVRAVDTMTVSRMSDNLAESSISWRSRMRRRRTSASPTPRAGTLGDRGELKAGETLLVLGAADDRHGCVDRIIAPARRRSMIRRLLTGLVGASVPLLGEVVAPAAGPGTPCANIAALTIPSVTIKSATAIAAGPFQPSGSGNALTLPSFCRVEATARPTSDSEIRFEVWIPPSDTWNSKFQGVGNGGYSGAIGYAAMAAGLRRGYALASTDTGQAGR